MIISYGNITHYKNKINYDRCILITYDFIKHLDYSEERNNKSITHMIDNISMYKFTKIENDFLYDNYFDFLFIVSINENIESQYFTYHYLFIIKNQYLYHITFITMKESNHSTIEYIDIIKMNEDDIWLWKMELSNYNKMYYSEFFKKIKLSYPSLTFEYPKHLCYYYTHNHCIINKIHQKYKPISNMNKDIFILLGI